MNHSSTARFEGTPGIKESPELKPVSRENRQRREKPLCPAGERVEPDQARSSSVRSIPRAVSFAYRREDRSSSEDQTD